MWGTRLKLALLFVVSMVAVVVLATVVTLWLLRESEPRRMIGPLAHSIVMSLDLREGRFERKLGPERMTVTSTRPVGRARPELTRLLAETLRRYGIDTAIEVVDRRPGDTVVSVAASDGKWLVFPVINEPPVPPPVWSALWAWLTIMLLGVSGAAVLIAYRITKPLGLLEHAVASVGPDGVLPKVPVEGTGEVRHMARTLNRLSDRLKGAMESRMRLVAAAGHDLRTPMTRMRLRAEFLSEDERAVWLSDIDELQAIAESAIRLVNEEGAGEDRQAVALADLVRDTTDELAAAHLDVQLLATQPALVRAGPLALRRAFRNLIINAATHGGGARVTLSGTGEEALLVVEDDGPGIPEALIPRVFEPFFRADPARAQTIKGAGLGLAIAREIIERMGGSIEISNRAEGGLRQLVRLPLAA